MRASIAGTCSKLFFRLAKFRALGSAPDSARHRQLAPPAQGKSVDRGDDRLAKVLDEVGQCLSPTSRLFCFYSCVVGDLRDVGACRKRLLTDARDDDSMDG